MHSFATLAAFVASASAYSLKLVNNCEHDAYIWSCGDDLGDMQTVEAGKTWSEEFYSKEGGSAGPSIYVSNGTSHSDGNIAQLEYFYQTSAQKIWWDISLINGNPFPTLSYGSDLEDCPYQACEAVKCVENNCNGQVYRTHEQLAGTHDCPPSNLIVELCNAGDSSSDDSSDSSSDAAPVESSSAPVAAPETSTQAPAPEATSEVQEAPEATTTAVATPTGGYLGEDKNGNVVMHTAYATTVVTAYVTETAKPDHGHALKADSDGNVIAKREPHGHAHAHNNARSRVRRHQHSE
jgi:hypothetical protein